MYRILDVLHCSTGLSQSPCRPSVHVSDFCPPLCHVPVVPHRIYDVSTPTKVREFLIEQNIAFPDETTEDYLLTLAKRRIRRLEEVNTPQRPQRYAGALTVSEVKDRMSTMKERAERDNQDGKSFISMKGKIIEYSEEFVRLKHQVVDNDRCKGRVTDGVCMTCHTHTPGVLAFSFQIVIQDMEHSNCTLNAFVSDKGGRALFGMSPAEFNNLPSSERRDKLETIEDVAIGMRAILSYQIDEDYFSLIVWQATILPPPTA